MAALGFRYPAALACGNIKGPADRNRGVPMHRRFLWPALLAPLALGPLGYLPALADSSKPETRSRVCETTRICKLERRCGRFPVLRQVCRQVPRTHSACRDVPRQVTKCKQVPRS